MPRTPWHPGFGLSLFEVIDLKHLEMAVFMGAALMLVGLVPGLLQALVTGVYKLNELFSEYPYYSYPEHANLRHPVWLAGLGATLIALAVIAYL